ncbi:hypothetical protein C0J52_04839 [Blattella germanica]|nr:hypothetical protein C0J52_04839 [Blattella germanica]
MKELLLCIVHISLILSQKMSECRKIDKVHGVQLLEVPKITFGNIFANVSVNLKVYPSERKSEVIENSAESEPLKFMTKKMKRPTKLSDIKLILKKLGI